jgi:hypothetical protein
MSGQSHTSCQDGAGESMPVDVPVPTCNSLASEGSVSFGLWLGRKV